MSFEEFKRFVENSFALKSGLIPVKIKKIEKLNFDEMVYDFTVNHPHHNFIANNVIVSNCGMRLVLTNLTYQDVKPYLKEIVDKLFERVPAGVGSTGFVKISKDEFRKVVEEGAHWAVEKGYGWQEDLERTELNGRADWADSTKISNKAVERGYNQIGTLGSGNHYLEIQWVKPENIKDEKIAKKWGIFPDQIVIMFHCLPGDAKVMTEHNCWIKIEDLERNWKKIKVKVFDGKTHKLVDSEIESFYKLPAKEKFYKIVTESGREIVVTEDHPILTKEGLKLPKELSKNDYVIIYPFDGVEYEEPSNEIIVDENDIRKVYNSDKVVKGLKKKGLLPLRTNNPKLPILTKLLGYLLGDGYLQRAKKRWFIRVIGNVEDLEEIRKEFKKLGYSLTPPRKYESESEIEYINGKKRKIKGSIYQSTCGSTSLAILLNCLGLPYGKKSLKEFRVPKWLFRTPKWIKRNFLAGFFGAELSSPSTPKNENKRFRKIVIPQYKIDSLKENCKEFLRDIKSLLEVFGIKVNRIKESGKIVTKDNKIYVRIIMDISSKSENLKKLFGLIGYEFNFERSRKSCYALQFLKLKDKINLEESKITKKQISKVVFTNNKYRKIYLPSYYDFVNEFKLNPPSMLILDRVEKVEIINREEKFVYDIRVKNKNHNFIANNFVVGNCGSRGFGHQVATDYLQVFLNVMERKYGIKILDRELACAPFFSPEGQDYYKAMACGVNMSFANRQVILHRIREVFSEVFKKDAESLGMKMVFDIAHNRATLEKHEVDGRNIEVLVHRKGATAAYYPGREEIPKMYKEDGSPVIIGGSMETGSYLLVGSEGAKETFCTTAHGSGRTMSRTKSIKIYGRQIKQRLKELWEKRGIYIRSVSLSGAAEEVGPSYKDIDEVIEATHLAGISKKVCKLVPIGNIKG